MDDGTNPLALTPMESTHAHPRFTPALACLLALCLGGSAAAQDAAAPSAEASPSEAESPSPAAASAEQASLPPPTGDTRPSQPLLETLDRDEMAEPPPEAASEFEPKFTVGVGLRTGLAYGLSGPGEKQLSLNDGLVDQVHARPFLSGSLHPMASYFFQLEIGTPGGLGVSILDAIAQLKFLDELQLWVGQHIPANDRNNMNGPFFGNTWNFAIAVEEYPFDAGARDRGATLWGLIAGGVLKYHLSVVDLQPGRKISKSRVAGRLTLHLLEPEAMYYNSGTYFGAQDILALGAVVQAQKGEEGTDSDLVGFSFDLMFEKNLGAAGTLTAEAGYWNYKGTGDRYVVNQGTADAGMGVAGPYPGTAFMGVLSWLTPDKVGIGQLQPNARIQYADFRTEKRTVIDVGLAYVVDGFNHKYHLNYRHAEIEPVGADETTSEDLIQLGVQYLMSN